MQKPLKAWLAVAVWVLAASADVPQRTVKVDVSGVGMVPRRLKVIIQGDSMATLVQRIQQRMGSSLPEGARMVLRAPDGAVITAVNDIPERCAAVVEREGESLPLPVLPHTALPKSEREESGSTGRHSRHSPEEMEVSPGIAALLAGDTVAALTLLSAIWTPLQKAIESNDKHAIYRLASASRVQAGWALIEAMAMAGDRYEKDIELVASTVIKLSIPMIRLRGSSRYLDLLKRSLVNSIYEDEVNMMPWQANETVTRAHRLNGNVWPSRAHTMIGRARLDVLQYCMEQVVHRGVPGDVMETGVWRGGASIFMAAVLQEHGDSRTVWVADSFQGLPSPSLKQDEGMNLHEMEMLAVSIKEVQGNFRRYGLVDDEKSAEKIRFMVGWFNETMPKIPTKKIALLRLDGDMYGSTMDVLTHMYPKVVKGGYVIIDDYAIPECALAVNDYRHYNGILEPMVPISGGAMMWRRTMPAMMPEQAFSAKKYDLKPAQATPLPY